MSDLTVICCWSFLICIDCNQPCYLEGGVVSKNLPRQAVKLKSGPTFCMRTMITKQKRRDDTVITLKPCVCSRKKGKLAFNGGSGLCPPVLHTHKAPKDIKYN